MPKGPGSVVQRARPPAHAILIALIALAAIGLRLYGQNWDDGHLFHPDERNILMVSNGLDLPSPLTLSSLLSVDSPLNPKSFAYGSFSFYLLRGLSVGMSWVGQHVGALSFWSDVSDLVQSRLVGRTLSALFDLGTVFLVYVLGRRLYAMWVGVLASAFVAFSVLDVQLSHFFASDTLLTFFLMAVLAGLVGVYRSSQARWPLLTGLALGLAFATKVSAAPILAAVGVVYLLRVFTFEKEGRLVRRDRWTHELAPAIRSGIAVAITAGIVFAVISPYAIIDFKDFYQQVGEQNLMSSGAADFPYTRQYAGRPDYLYFIQNLSLFGLGLPLGIAAFAGWIYVIVRGIRRPTFGDVLLLSWIVPYFAIVGQFYAKFLRYMLPITPVLCLLAAVGLYALGTWAASRRPRLRPYALGLAVLVVGLTAAYAVAYDSIYSMQHTAVRASAWIYANVKQGSTIATEHWEEGMPVPLQEGGRQVDSGTHGYRIVTLPLYDDDNSAKLSEIASALDRADYVVFFSNRLYGTIPRLPERYPMSSEYYKLLFGGKLGYQLVADFTSYPTLGPVALVDDTLADPGLPTPPLLQSLHVAPITIHLGHADESFSVYDHPKVLVFKRTERLGAARIADMLRPYLQQGSLAPAQSNEQYKSLAETPAELAANQAGGTYSELFDPLSLPNQVPVLVWVVLAEVLGLGAAPLAFAVTARLADRGYLLSKTLGALLVGWLSWIIVVLGLMPNGRTPVALALVLLLAAGGAALYLQREEILRFVRARWRLLVAGEVLFWAAFAMFIVIRMHNPDLWHPARGGEKPMDLAFLMAAIKTTTFPPYDPWLAGGVLNYYYFGQVILASLIRLTGIVPTTAYNIVVPYLYALSMVGAFAVAASLIGVARGWRRPVVGGVMASVLMGVIGNLGGSIQFAEMLGNLGGVTYTSAIPGVTSVVRVAGGLLALAQGKALEIPSDWYWPSTRVIPGTINEFPFFTFLYADLHAHMIALPITLLALGLAVNVALGAAPRLLGLASVDRMQAGFVAPATASLARVLPELRGWALVRALVRPGLAVLVIALAVGALYPTNSWDYPTYVGIVGVSLLIPWYRSKDRAPGDLLLVLARLAVIVALSYVLYLPFHLRFQSFYSGVQPYPDKSPIGAYLVIHGLLLAGLMTFVVRDLHERLGRYGTFRFLGICLRNWDRLPRAVELRRVLVVYEDEPGVALVILAIGVLAVGALLALLGMALVGLLFVLLVAVMGLLFQRDRPTQETFLLLLAATGLALGIGTELVALDGDVGRMNTVFKFYFQVWVLWSVGAAVSLVLAWDSLRLPGLRRIWLGVVVVLFAVSMVYPLMATPARLRDRYDPTIPPTLDGTAYMKTAVQEEQGLSFPLSGDLAAIHWLQQNVTGSPVVLEGQAPIYHWGSRISIYTGLPTVIGWDWHEEQQRWGYREEIDVRKNDVATIYRNPTSVQAQALLLQYHVQYVVVGALERAYYPGPGLAQLDQLVGSRLDLVYNQQGVKIYRVRGQGS